MDGKKFRWRVMFLLLTVLALASLIYQPAYEVLADAPPIDKADTAWMLTAAGLVLLMTPGLSFFYGGMVSEKNIISTMLQSFIALGVVSFLWFFVGFSMAFGESISGIIGDPRTFFMFKNVGLGTNAALSPTIPLLLFAFFQLKFAIITPALITGSFAERVRFTGYLLFISLFSLFIYAPLAHWTWHPEGFLRKLGVLDFAGGSVVHMSAGFAALAGAAVLGKRKNFYDSRENHQPANIPYVILGTGLLWFGWFGFNAGSALGANESAALAFATTHLASASAMITWVLFDAILGRKISALGACIGAVVGLVAITPAAGYVTVGQSIFIGFASAIASNLVLFYKNKSTIDDTLDVFPCHGVGGIAGMLMTGIFAKDVGLIYGDPRVFLNHVLALLIVSAFAFGGSFILYKVTDSLIALRVHPEEEEIGLDISQHAETISK